MYGVDREILALVYARHQPDLDSSKSRTLSQSREERVPLLVQSTYR